MSIDDDDCKTDEFKCQGDGKCISNKFKCDCNIDCSDLSDELDCSGSTSTPIEYNCMNKTQNYCLNENNTRGTGQIWCVNTKSKQASCVNIELVKCNMDFDCLGYSYLSDCNLNLITSNPNDFYNYDLNGGGDNSLIANNDCSDIIYKLGPDGSISSK